MTTSSLMFLNIWKKVKFEITNFLDPNCIMLTLTACHFNIKLSKTNPIYEGNLCNVCKPAGRILHNRDQTQNTVMFYITMKKCNCKTKKPSFFDNEKNIKRSGIRLKKIKTDLNKTLLCINLRAESIQTKKTHK